MNTQSNAVHNSPLDSRRIAPAFISAPLYWSIRRELWENRSIYIAPLAVAAAFLFGFLISLIGLPHRMRAALALDPAKQLAAIEMPYHIASGLIMATAFFVGLFYCIEALQGERRDRSILFWKSLPVSDLTTVLAKATIPLVLLLLSFIVTVVTQLIMLLLSTSVLAMSGVNPAPLWTQLALFHQSQMLLYHLMTVHGLWYAPLYAWLLLVSAWARRVAFLWAVLPLLAIGFAEKIAFNTSHFAAWLFYRFSGPESFSMDLMTSPNPGKFFSTPGLWIGLVLAAAFLVTAAQLRRYRGPI
jgi:ABC-2 type transport system permease protein